MDERVEDELLLRLTVDRLMSTGEWPTLEELHREIHQSLGEEMDVSVVARRLAPHPLYMAYTDLGDSFAPPLLALARVREADDLVAAVLRFIVYARDKYLSSSGETRVTEHEVREALGLDGHMSRILKKVTDGIPYLRHGNGSSAEGWHIRVSDHITRWKGVESRDDLLDRLATIEDQARDEYGAMARAKADLVRGTQHPVVVASEKDQEVHWYETPLAQGAAWTIGIIATVIAIIVGVSQF